MKNLLERTESYLRELEQMLTGFDRETAFALPLVLRERYQLYSASLFGRRWLLAVESEGWDPGSPTEYQQHRQQIEKTTGKDHVVLVLPFISATVRNRMINMGIPFVVPQAQVFLPLSMINLRESYGGARTLEGKPLSPTAQALILYQLQKSGLQNLSSKEISNRLGYSRASISTACSELEQNGLCHTFRKGKELRVEFLHNSRELWNTALPLLRSPIRKTQFVKWEQSPPEARLAGISALSRQSSLSDDKIPWFAMEASMIRRGLEQGRFNGCPDWHEADARIEAWSYDPALLFDDETVDPLSLYLSLRDNPDERVQSELAAMMKDFPWR